MAPTHASRSVAGRRDREEDDEGDAARGQKGTISAESRAKLEKAFARFDTE